MKFKVGQCNIEITFVELSIGRIVVDINILIAGKVLGIVCSKDCTTDENIDLKINYYNEEPH